MSCRNAISQPESAIAHSAAPTNRAALIFIAHLGYMLGTDALQELCRFFQMEFRIVRLDTQKEFVVRSALESLYVKKWMMRLRQAIQRQHSKHRKRRRAENCQFKCHGNKRRPAV